MSAAATPEAPIDTRALERWMAERMPGFTGPVTLTKFKGGQSNPTYRAETPGGAYVLRRQPFGRLLPSAHAVDREYGVIAALHPTGFPVPKPYFGLCADDSVIGSMFYVMELVEGRNLWEGPLPGYEPAERRAIYHAMIDTMAQLHRVDPASVGLEDFGKPGDYLARQIGRWSKQYRASETEPIPAMDRLMAWLPTTMPAQDRVSIVHGDYRIDNMFFHTTEPRVVAVLDWELSTLGNPLADFTYFMMPWMTDLMGASTICGLDHATLGIPTRDEAVARYCAGTGRDAIGDLDWYWAYNLFRFTAILQGVKKRALDGTASSAEAHGRADRIVPIAEQGWEFAVRAGA